MLETEPFIRALLNRHAAAMRRPEFLKAIRALSARYVERRAMLADRSPLDSPGKRAAFAAYYAPLHYLTVGHILEALGSRTLDRIVDLGCGTGVAGAAWAGVIGGRPTVHGVDRSGWAVTEAAWTYRALGLKGRATRGDLVRAAESLTGRIERERLDTTGVIIAWSGNELDEPARRRLLGSLVDLARRGAAVLVIEPISRRTAPWIDDWAKTIAAVGGRQDDWRFEEPRPAALAEIDADVGFARDALTARSLSVGQPAPCGLFRSPSQ